MIHIFATHGAESGDDCARRTVSFDGPPSGTWPRNRLCQFNSGMGAPFHNLSDETTFANGFIDRGAGASTQAAQDAAFGAAGIIDRPAARAARSLGHPSFVSNVSIGAQAGAIEPRLIEEFPRLHVKTDRNKTGLAERIGRRPSAGAAAKVARDAFARHQVNPAAFMIAVVIAVMVTILFASLVPIVLTILRRRQRCQCDHQQNCEYGGESQCPVSP